MAEELLFAAHCQKYNRATCNQNKPLCEVDKSNTGYYYIIYIVSVCVCACLVVCLTAARFLNLILRLPCERADQSEANINQVTLELPLKPLNKKTLI